MLVSSEYHPLLAGGHWQTLYAWGRQRRFPNLPPPAVRYFDVASDARVLAHCHWQPSPSRCPAMLLLHGLEGDDSDIVEHLAERIYLPPVIENRRETGPEIGERAVITAT